MSGAAVHVVVSMMVEDGVSARRKAMNPFCTKTGCCPARNMIAILAYKANRELMSQVRITPNDQFRLRMIVRLGKLSLVRKRTKAPLAKSECKPKANGDFTP